jgi:hypothetical protein
MTDEMHYVAQGQHDGKPSKGPPPTPRSLAISCPAAQGPRIATREPWAHLHDLLMHPVTHLQRDT